MTPTPPTGVRLVLADLTEVPCRVEYVGPNDRGCHLWEAVPIHSGALGHGAVVAGLRADTLPAHTGIIVTLAEDPWADQ